MADVNVFLANHSKAKSTVDKLKTGNNLFQHWGLPGAVDTGNDEGENVDDKEPRNRCYNCQPPDAWESTQKHYEYDAQWIKRHNVCT